MNKAILVLSAMVFACSPGVLLAEDQLPSSVMVNVRAVRASEKVNDPKAVAAVASSAAHEINLDSRLRDLSSKLGKLCFRTFKLAGQQSDVVPFGKRETMNLIDGNTLTVRPLSFENKRVGMWIRWQDGSGMEVLDTRMRFEVGQSMLTGVESKGDTGLILAIDVRPVDEGEVVAKPAVEKR